LISASIGGGDWKRAAIIRSNAAGMGLVGIGVTVGDGPGGVIDVAVGVRDGPPAAAVAVRVWIGALGVAERVGFVVGVRVGGVAVVVGGVTPNPPPPQKPPPRTYAPPLCTLASGWPAVPPRRKPPPELAVPPPPSMVLRRMTYGPPLCACMRAGATSARWHATIVATVPERERVSRTLPRRIVRRRSGLALIATACVRIDPTR
jgi:hypothetical protein